MTAAAVTSKIQGLQTQVQGFYAAQRQKLVDAYPTAAKLSKWVAQYQNPIYCVGQVFCAFRASQFYLLGMLTGGLAASTNINRFSNWDGKVVSEKQAADFTILHALTSVFFSEIGSFCAGYTTGSLFAHHTESWILSQGPATPPASVVITEEKKEQ